MTPRTLERVIPAYAESPAMPRGKARPPLDMRKVDAAAKAYVRRKYALAKPSRKPLDMRKVEAAAKAYVQRLVDRATQRAE